MKKSKFDTNFEKIDHDFYRTFDVRAHIALNDFLKPNITFAEPCTGYGDLIRGLEAFDHKCVYSSELIKRDDPPFYTPDYTHIHDAFDLCATHVANADYIITNPPWTRKVLHPMIEHFVSLKPTILLFEADWAHTKQAIPYLDKWCTDIVSVGRLKWIEGTKGGSLKDCSWYVFNKDKSGPITFHQRKG